MVREGTQQEEEEERERKRANERMNIKPFDTTYRAHEVQLSHSVHRKSGTFENSHSPCCVLFVINQENSLLAKITFFIFVK